jgi:hypothetical protein
VTNIALMELGKEIKDSKYEDYVLKNMNFVFNDGNYDYYQKLYTETLAKSGWMAVREKNETALCRFTTELSTMLSIDGNGFLSARDRTESR